MKYLLDTNICIYMIRQKAPAVLGRFESVQPGDVAVSAITVAELQYGAARSRYPEQNRAALSQFLLPLMALDFDQAAADVYGRLRANLEERGQPIGALDQLIAAQAIAHNLTLVTNNLREFERIPDLRLENWAGP